jgi:Zn-dependent peptidase ImmA (M78 family)
MPVEAIRALAEEILTEHQSDGGIPIRIEEIIEFGLNIEIRPVRALQARYNFEGAIGHDLQTIVVDEDIMRRLPNRYHFTLAHELGHVVMHGDYIQSLAFSSRDEWKAVVMGIDAKMYGRMENQAYVFAGHLLVPSSALLASCQEAQALAARNGIDLAEMGANAISYVAGYIAKEYKVSTEVIERRLAAERIFS